MAHAPRSVHIPDLSRWPYLRVADQYSIMVSRSGPLQTVWKSAVSAFQGVCIEGFHCIYMYSSEYIINTCTYVVYIYASKNQADTYRDGLK